MEALNRDRKQQPEQAGQEFYKVLDKGIDDMENGRIMSHEDAMQMIRESVKNHDI